jgi:antitoxin component of MazEF toxin-antitoxin module
VARIDNTQPLVRVCRINKHGDSICVVLNRHVRDLVPWQRGDSIAVRLAGEKLILERINLQDYAKLRTGEVEARPETKPI